VTSRRPFADIFGATGSVVDTPEQWAVKPIKSWIRLKLLADRPMKYGANEAALADDQDQPRFIRITDITEDGSLRADTFKSLPQDMAQDYMLDDGDLLFARSGATAGKALIYQKSWGPACFAGYLIQFRCNRAKLLPKFLFYFTQGSDYWSQIGVSIIQATIQNVSAERYGDIVLPVPPIPVQRAITEYLDRETARLDGLIVAKERVLGLLAEKRRALITRAVTRGIDSRAPLRDSGIPWLGEIPAHWAAERLRFHLHRIEQGWSPQCDNVVADANEWGVLKAGSVNGWEFDPNDNKRLPEILEPLREYEIRSGDVLMSRANTTDLLGSAALVRVVRPRLLLCDKLYRLEVNESRLSKEYLLAFLRCPAGRCEFERDATGASNSMQNIGQDSVRNLWLPVPPLDEQSAIVAHIAAETAKLDALRSATERTIALLKERRTALIAAAVTGQLQIREATGLAD
jgi:type I restriction enzyme S subunit